MKALKKFNNEKQMKIIKQKQWNGHNVFYEVSTPSNVVYYIELQNYKYNKPPLILRTIPQDHKY